MKILICNAGSTSLKFKLWKMPEFEVLAQSYVERVGSDNAIFSYNSPRGSFSREKLSIPDYTAGITMFLDVLSGEEYGMIAGLDEQVGWFANLSATGKDKLR